MYKTKDGVKKIVEKNLEQELEEARGEIRALRTLIEQLETDRELGEEYRTLIEYVKASDDPAQLANEWWEDKLELKQLRSNHIHAGKNI